MSVNKKTLAKFEKNMKDGTIINMKGSASWSTERDVSEGFAKENYLKRGDNDQPVLFVSEFGQPLGTSIRYLSRYANEHEILCSKKARYTITKSVPGKIRVYDRKEDAFVEKKLTLFIVEPA